MVRRPSLAPISPPDTGQSRVPTLCAFASSAILLARLGVDVVKSHSIDPGLQP